MTKKVARHPEIDEDETVLHACYGLSADFVALGNAAAAGLSSLHRSTISPTNTPDAWNSDFVGQPGLASALTVTGVLALTNQRLIYFRKAVVVGNPKKILATWPLEQLSGAGYEDKILLLRFSDGSVGGLHVPGSQNPKRFLEAFEEVVKPEPGGDPASTGDSH
ncbi:MAG: hypothetical protein AAGC68_16395 [Verrucomicrobiota bacterium]